MHPDAIRRDAGPVIGQLYVSAAVLAFAALFVPLYVESATTYPPLSSVDPSSRVGSYSLWRGVVYEGQGIAVVATLLVLVLVVLSVVAANGSGSFLVPAALLVLGVLGIVVLILDPQRPGSVGSGAGLGMLWGAVLVVVATSAVHLFRSTQVTKG